MKIAITGSHWVGKSTLIDLLENKKELGHFKKIPEVAREEILKRGKTPDKMTLEEKIDFEQTLLKKQIELEWQNSKFISDRCVLDILVYSEFLLGNHKTKDEIKELVKNYLIEKSPYDKIFYIPIEFELKLDWIRFEDIQFQKTVDEKFIYFFKEFWIEPIILKWNTEQRLSTILQHI